MVTIAISCSKSDEIEVIFTGHDWKLTYVNEGGVRRWPSAGKTYSLKFTSNKFTATTPGGGNITGRWQADGKSRSFQCSDIRTTGITPKDTIAQRIIETFTAAQSYTGDTHYLQIIKDKEHYIQFYNR